MQVNGLVSDVRLIRAGERSLGSRSDAAAVRCAARLQDRGDGGTAEEPDRDERRADGGALRQGVRGPALLRRLLQQGDEDLQSQLLRARSR